MLKFLKTLENKLNAATDPRTNFHRLEHVGAVGKPYKSKVPFFVPGKPVLLDPTIDVDQLVLLNNGDCIYQGDVPPVMDIDRWQQVIKGLRWARAVNEGELSVVEVALIRRGEVLYHAPAPKDDEYNYWEKILNDVRMVANAPTIGGA